MVIGFGLKTQKMGKDVIIFNEIKSLLFIKHAIFSLFTEPEIARIKQITAYDVIMAVTQMDDIDIPRQPFKAPKASDHDLITKCRLLNPLGNGFFHLPQLNVERLAENCTQPDSYDYFYNSEASYIVSFSFVAAFIIGEYLGL